MTRIGTRRDVHPDDGELVRLIDAELSGRRHARATRHLERCAPCDERARAIRRRSTALSALLAETDAPSAAPANRIRPPARRTSGRGATRPPTALARARSLRAAAVVGLLVAVGLGVAPARAWIAAGLERAARVLAPAEDPAAPEPPSAQRDGIALAFVPAGDRLAVEVERRQAAGAVVIRVTDAPSISATASADGTDAAFLVLPDGLGIRNAAASRAVYTIAVPASIADVEVVIGGERVASLATRGMEPGATHRIDLTAPRD